MAEARDRFLDDVRAYVGAGERLVEGVSAFVEMNRQALVDLEAGMPMSESFAKRDSATWSRMVSALLDEFEACRRAPRESAAAGLIEEGRSVTDVGRACGVSHQLASRFARSVRANGGDVADPPHAG